MEHTSAVIFPFYDCPSELKALSPGNGDDCDWVIVSENFGLAQLLADRLAVFEYTKHEASWCGNEVHVLITSHA